MSSFVISLDFELFWGVTDTRTVKGYRRNIEGVWNAIPKLLELFDKYEIRATWATVGMLMCRDYGHWRQLRPELLPAYQRKQCSNYEVDELVQAHPQLFFARPLVERILDTPGQELATHTYSHFYCAEAGPTPEQFYADLACAQSIARDFGVTCRSLVFPRNQARPEFLDSARRAGIRVWRGNPAHWLYRDGHRTPGGPAGRAVRFADAWLPFTGQHAASPQRQDGMVNVPGSMFLRPYSAAFAALEPLKLHRLRTAMSAAARRDATFHLWWHPHNFGTHLERNLAMLESLLQHFRMLHDQVGMRSVCMMDFAEGAL